MESRRYRTPSALPASRKLGSIWPPAHIITRPPRPQRLCPTTRLRNYRMRLWSARTGAIFPVGHRRRLPGRRQPRQAHVSGPKTAAIEAHQTAVQYRQRHRQHTPRRSRRSLRHRARPRPRARSGPPTRRHRLPMASHLIQHALRREPLLLFSTLGGAALSPVC